MRQGWGPLKDTVLAQKALQWSQRTLGQPKNLESQFSDSNLELAQSMTVCMHQVSGPSWYVWPCLQSPEDHLTYKNRLSWRLKFLIRNPKSWTYTVIFWAKLQVGVWKLRPKNFGLPQKWSGHPCTKADNYYRNYMPVHIILAHFAKYWMESTNTIRFTVKNYEIKSLFRRGLLFCWNMWCFQEECTFFSMLSAPSQHRSHTTTRISFHHFKVEDIDTLHTTEGLICCWCPTTYTLWW